jgi:hypothetical protein
MFSNLLLVFCVYLFLTLNTTYSFVLFIRFSVCTQSRPDPHNVYIYIYVYVQNCSNNAMRITLLGGPGIEDGPTIIQFSTQLGQDCATHGPRWPRIRPRWIKIKPRWGPEGDKGHASRLQNSPGAHPGGRIQTQPSCISPESLCTSTVTQYPVTPFSWSHVRPCGAADFQHCVLSSGWSSCIIGWLGC